MTNILSREQYSLKAQGHCISASRRVRAPGLSRPSLGTFSSLLCCAPVSKIDTFRECAGKEQHVMGLVARRSQNTYQLLYLFTSSKKASFRGTCLLACNQTLCALPCLLKIDLHMLCSSGSLLACRYEMSLLVSVAGRGCSLPLGCWHCTWVTRLPRGVALSSPSRLPKHHKRGSCVFKKKKVELSGSSRLYLLLPREWTQFDLPKLLWTRNKALLERWKSAVKKITRIM